MLSDDEKARIEAEEEYRAKVRQRLGAPLSPVPVSQKASGGNTGCLIGGLCGLAFLGIFYPPFFVGALMIALFWAAIKYLTK